jgi:hypothetical protein
MLTALRKPVAPRGQEEKYSLLLNKKDDPLNTLCFSFTYK